MAEDSDHIFQEKPLRRGAETIENKRAHARVFSALLGLAERLAYQALDGIYGQNLLTTTPPSPSLLSAA